MTFYPGIAPPRATYDELSGSGLLNDIGSASVREAVADYYSELAWIQSQLEYFRQTTVPRLASAQPGQATVYDPKMASLEDRFVHSADFDVIAAVPEYMTQLVNELRDQMVFQTYRKGLARAAEGMCGSLAAALHLTCAAAASSPE